MLEDNNIKLEQLYIIYYNIDNLCLQRSGIADNNVLKIIHVINNGLKLNM